MASDEGLMARVIEGEQSALELLFARWEGPLFAFFYRQGCPPGAVEELTEETLVCLFRQRRRYDPRRAFAPWLFGVARLVWKDYLRHHGRQAALTASLDAAAEVAAEAPDPSGVAEAHEKADQVRRAIERLPDEQRTTFLLRHYHGLTYEEIARVLRVPVGTVKWRVHDAVRRLSAALAALREV
jgi:RNA polymerase sigma-70 factor (ECF subfamily)